jgi:predicted AAA+ superfamily ATPase
MISRRLSTQFLMRLAEFPAVGLLGPRQVGKSSLAQTIVHEVEGGSSRPHYLDLDSPADQAKLFACPRSG